MLQGMLGLSRASAQLATSLEPREHGATSPVSYIREAIEHLHASAAALAAVFAVGLATTGALLAAGGVVTALAWIVLDPLLATTGIHRRRLDRFATALGEELRGGRGGAYRVRDHYIARVFDVLELLRTATTAFR